MSVQRLLCDGIPELVHVNEPCSRELGRVRGVILFDETFAMASLIAYLQSGTTSDAREVVSMIDAGITAGKVHIINQTKGSYSPEPHTADGYNEGEKRLLWYNNNLQFDDPTYEENRDFWSHAQKDQRYVAWRTENLLHFADKPANIVITDPISDDVNSAVTWHAELTWKSKELPQIAKVGIFDKILTYGGIPHIFTREYSEEFI